MRTTVREMPAPRGLTLEEVARSYFRRSPKWLFDHLDELEGFPKRDPLFKVFNREQVETWWRKRFGVAEPAVEGSLDEAEAALIARLERQAAQGKRKGARRGEREGSLSGREEAA